MSRKVLSRHRAPSSPRRTWLRIHCHAAAPPPPARPLFPPLRSAEEYPMCHPSMAVMRSSCVATDTRMARNCDARTVGGTPAGNTMPVPSNWNSLSYKPISSRKRRTKMVTWNRKVTTARTKVELTGGAWYIQEYISWGSAIIAWEDPSLSALLEPSQSSTRPPPGWNNSVCLTPIVSLVTLLSTIGSCDIPEGRPLPSTASFTARDEEEEGSSTVVDRVTEHRRSSGMSARIS
mmetsp:Transcript_9184/g.27628  ORF Transcript_9184/g.27628 Transcript_9184/m.27628 type:complete len:234 (-) Transcript_9184:57-758(-)